MASRPRLLLVGTADTKADEIHYLRERIAAAGGTSLVMDVGVMPPSALTPDVSNEAVAAAASTTIEAVRTSGDENTAMQLMAQGAVTLAARLHGEGRIDGLLALGGSMGTDLALDVASALPLGVPKVLLSTVAHSHLIAPERIAPDLIQVLWAGGLYGLNPVCRSVLSQAAGAAVGACLVSEKPRGDRPLVGMSSLGKSCLAYMVHLKPALEARGYELAVFHTTGMGGRAFEALAQAGRFCAVMDFSLQELANHLAGSCVTSGPGRLTGAGQAGVPQLVAPGACDMVDYAGWAGCPPAYAGRATHEHNRLIGSTSADIPLRLRIAQEIGARTATARGPVAVLLPTKGIEAWDLPGEPMHDPAGLAAFQAALRQAVRAPAELIEVDAHINEPAFAQAALARFDAWVAQGLIPRGVAASVPA
ncbi:MAG: hypothetical protein RL722_2176 [Pseudomonadota bacterium]|jgi:uncharacterized protein (UPF0261 family)